MSVFEPHPHPEKLAKSVSAYLEPKHIAMMDHIHREFGINKGEQVQAVFDFFINEEWELHRCLLERIETSVDEHQEMFNEISAVVFSKEMGGK
tara:strand:- start:138 stop:416 length:279 start_codon:yes stop_codon:yes gene_type:complete